MTGLIGLIATTFFASCVEAIEMATIVVGVGTTRGWRSTLVGTAAGAAVLLVFSAVFGTAITLLPIAWLRIGVGALLLVFGLQWLRKGILRVAQRGLAGYQGHLEDAPPPATGVDWTSFTLAFKAVVLEGLEIAFIVVSFGQSARHLGAATAAGLAALALIGMLALFTHGLVARIPRSLLQLVVGVMLVSFGTFWSVEGLGGKWPLGDGMLPLVVALNVVFAAAFVILLRARRAQAGASVSA